MRFAAMVWAGCLASVACNQVFGVRSTVLVDAAPPVPPIQFVQIAVGETFGDGMTETTFANNVTDGDALIVCVYSDGDPVKVVDSVGNTYTLLVGPTPYLPNANALMYVFVALPVGGEPATLQALSSNSTDLLVYSHEFANVTAVDATSSQQGTAMLADAMTSGPMQTTQTGDLIFGFGISRMVIRGSTFRPLSSLDGNLTEYRIADQPGAYEAIATDTSDPVTSWTMMGAAFRGP